MNQDGNVHTATADNFAWDTGGLSLGQSRTIVFNKQGTQNYHSQTDVVYGQTGGPKFSYQLQGTIRVGPPGVAIVPKPAQVAPPAAPQVAALPTPSLSKGPGGISLVSGNNSPGAPFALQPGQTVNGLLPTSSGASYAYFSLVYRPSADGSARPTAVVSLRYSPSDPIASNNVGFTIYDSNGSAVGQANAANAGAPGVPFGSDLTRVKNAYVWLPKADTLTVQVFSYHDQDVAYTIQATIT